MEDLDKSGRTSKRRTLDLSLAQVAASALAAVVGAVLASQLGVYGTILGAAVVSVGATTGGAVFQHVFRRTGEQLREMSSGAALVEPPHPAERETVGPGPDAGPPAGTGRRSAAEPTQVFDPFDPGGERTRMMARISPPEPAEAVAVYRGRNTWRPKSWKVYAVTATLVFALAMGTVGVMELVVGKPAGQWGGGGGGKPVGDSAPVVPSGGGTSGGERSGSGSEGKQGGATPSTGPSSTPHDSPSPSPSRSPDTGSSADPTSPTSPSGSAQAGSGAGSAAGSGASGDGAAAQATPSP